MFKTPDFKENNHANELPVATRILCAIAIGALGFGLIFALILTDNISSLLPELVQKKLTQSGVENPVTAVLLNFRSYDTLLEIGVLLTVAVAMLPNSHFDSDVNPDMPGSNRSDDRLVSIVNDAPVNHPLEALLRWLIPMIIVMAGYMLWTGAALPGGAFQSGALLAGAGVLAQLSGRLQFCFTSTVAKLLLTIGLITFVMVAVGVATTTGVILQYPLELAAPLILLIEGAATLSIAAILLLSYNTLATQKFESSSEPSVFDKQPSALSKTSAPNETLQSQTTEGPKP
ncbi:hydrogen gas-evolving membrane-bound hydrogenase subunit E [Marinobacter psychrophilus]|jgi:multisubunit Na+/H+ antiporter MnhB subunit|uniref:hydrogen gas-evolving membrane-bound hydrogenase subunit E n=1 Tax=Marinobacter psychrophilus TaxID=330734 RepID=UPI00069F5C66|nr:hydrogen gas-evolving membrane-bound hydrogenase subunit E [Marinobacter psychrophilus]